MLPLGRFRRSFADLNIAAVEPADLDKWLDGLNLSPQSRTNYRRVVGQLFNWAIKRKFIDASPISDTRKTKIPERAPEIYTVEELTALLNAASEVHPDLVPMLAIGAFAGVRTEELHKLDWTRHVKLARGHIEITADIAKKGKRRIIPILPNLAAWLAPLAHMQGSVKPKNARRKLDAVRKAVGIERLPDNGLRHSFASYRLAETMNAPQTAFELGHPNPTLLYSTYREVVTPKDAARYWQIAPKVEANVVQMSARALS